MMLARSETNLLLNIVGNDQDAQALRQAGFRSVQVISDVSHLYTGDMIRGDFGIYDQFRLAYRLEESDLRDGVAMRLGDTRCSWIRWTDDVGSAHGCLSDLGPAAVAEFVRTEAKPMWLDEVCLIDDVPDEGPLKTYTTGFEKLDEEGFRLIRPAFFGCIGPYGSGKSVLLRQLACNLWRLHGWRTLLTAFEERIKPRYIRDLRRHLLHDPNEPYYSMAAPEYSPDQIAMADAEIKKAFRFLRRKRNSILDADRLYELIEYAVKIYGVEVVIVDPLNEIDHNVPYGMSKTDYIGRFIMRLKALADDYNLLMIVAAHPPKEATGRRSSGYIYTLNDAADTANFGNKSDIGWCVWRPEKVGPTYLNIDKIKDTEMMGSEMLVQLSFQASAGRFVVTRTREDALGDLIGRA
jgi:twinkle protein